MASQIPLVLNNGKYEQLQTGDTLQGVNYGSSSYPVTVLGTSTTLAQFQTAYDALGTGGTLQLTPGSYAWSGAINLSGRTNVRVILTGCTITYSSGTVLMYSGGDRSTPVTNVKFIGGTFTCTVVSTTVSGSQVQSYDNAAVDGLSFVDTIFNAPTANCNGIGASMWNGSSGQTYKNVDLYQCHFNTGRMGAEFVNHGWDNNNFVYRISNVTVYRCTSSATGQVNLTGEGSFVSFSGCCKNVHVVLCQAKNALGVAYEFAGTSNFRCIGNEYEQTDSKTCAGIGVTDNNYFVTEKGTITGNTINTPTDKPLFIYGSKNMSVGLNTFIGLTYCDFKMESSTLSVNTFDIANTYALAFDSSVWNGTDHFGSDGPSRDNIVSANTIRTNRFAGGGAVVVFRGTGTTTGNDLGGSRGNIYINSTGRITSGYATEAGNATGNILAEYVTGISMGVLSANIVRTTTDVTEATLFSFTVQANKHYVLDCLLPYLSGATSQTIQTALVFPSGTANLQVIVNTGTNSGVGYLLTSNTFVGPASTTSLSGSSSLRFNISVGATGGTLTVKIRKPATTGNLTVYAGAMGILFQGN